MNERIKTISEFLNQEKCLNCPLNVLEVEYEICERLQSATIQELVMILRDKNIVSHRLIGEVQREGLARLLEWSGGIQV